MLKMTQLNPRNLLSHVTTNAISTPSTNSFSKVGLEWTAASIVTQPAKVAMHSLRFFRMMMTLRLLYQEVHMFLLAPPRTTILLKIMIKPKIAPNSWRVLLKSMQQATIILLTSPKSLEWFCCPFLLHNGPNLSGMPKSKVWSFVCNVCKCSFGSDVVSMVEHLYSGSINISFLRHHVSFPD